MEYNHSNEIDPLVDVERGGMSSEEDDALSEHNSGNRSLTRFLGKLVGGALGHDGSASDSSMKSESSSGRCNQDVAESIEVFMDSNVEGHIKNHTSFLEGEQANGKHNTTKSKKARKPPRPPNGPSLYASDLKLVQEISELAMKKRARIERMRALKKMKAAKVSPPSPSSSPSNISLFAMFITVVFLLVIIFQGLCSRSSSSASFHGSPEPASGRTGLFSVQFYDNNGPSNDVNRPTAESPSSVEQVTGASPELVFPG